MTMVSVEKFSEGVEVLESNFHDPDSGVDVAHQIISSTNGVRVPASTSSHAMR